MATDIDALKQQLSEAKYLLDRARFVDWRNPNGGMVDYNDQLIKVERLQIKLNRALKAEAG